MQIVVNVYTLHCKGVLASKLVSFPVTFRPIKGPFWAFWGALSSTRRHLICAMKERLHTINNWSCLTFYKFANYTWPDILSATLHSSKYTANVQDHDVPEIKPAVRHTPWKSLLSDSANLILTFWSSTCSAKHPFINHFLWLEAVQGFSESFNTFCHTF